MWPFSLILGIYFIRTIIYFLLPSGKPRRKDPGEKEFTPSVDILVPMYNEESVILETIRNLLEIKYDKLSIIVVDDGSTDNSFRIVKKYFGSHPLITLLRQPNGGKSSALNHAIKISNSDIAVTIDADTWVRPDAIRNILRYFRDPNVGAVAGHIKVGNRTNLLTEMQYFEYIAIWDNDRAFSDLVNGILIVPGALGAFRRSAVDAVGGFETTVIAEDTELTLRLLYNDYTIRNAADAVAYTEAPDNLRMFFRQRVRWTTGLTQGLVRHSAALSRHRPALAWFILPFTWAFRVVLPLLLPLADYYFLYAWLWLGRQDTLVCWTAIILTEAMTNLFILSKNQERVSIFKLTLLQRMYRHLLFFNYWFIFMKGVNGTLFSWGKVVKKGNLSLKDLSLKDKTAPEPAPTASPKP